MSKYEIGQFGEATFICKKCWKHPITCHGRIMDIDNKVLLFIDNDENEYIISRDKFKFEKKEFKIIEQRK